MNKVKFTLKGTVSNVNIKEDKDGKKYGVIQFLNLNNNGKLELIDVKVGEEIIEEVNKKIKEGKEVELEIDINCFRDKIYYKLLSL